MQSLAEILCQTNHLLLLQPSSYKLHTDMRTIIDLGIICKSKLVNHIQAPLTYYATYKSPW